MKENNKLSTLTRGIIKENPVLVLVLGTCPTLAVTTMASNGIGMGLAATFVLLCSNVVISALRKIIPDQVRIPAYISVIAGFVSVVQMLVKAFVPSLDASLHHPGPCRDVRLQEQRAGLRAGRHRYGHRLYHHPDHHGLHP